MTSPAGIAASAACAMAAGLYVLSAQTPAPGQTVFRAATDLVTVDVAVKASGAPVGGLSAHDFVVLDNGVPQRVIESIDRQTVPNDISVIVDTSQGMRDYIGSLSDQVEKIAALARPDDRVRVTAIDTYVNDILPLQPAATRPAIGALKVDGLASVNDAIGASLMRTADPDRRHLIIALTDGIDQVSALTAQTLHDIARQSDATLEIAWVTLAITERRNAQGVPYWDTSRERAETFRCGNAGRCVPASRYWSAFDEPPAPHTIHDFDLLRETAEETGGALHEPGVFTDRTAAAIFDKLYKEYRESYLLRYMPQGVPRAAWHDITVTIPAYPSYTIRARRGYAVDARAR